MNWFQIFALSLQVASAVEADVLELQNGQAATSPAFDITVGGKKYSVSLTATPVA